MLRIAIAALFLLAAVQPAGAKEYTAERFDSHIEVLRGGALRVTEIIVFRFDEGSFTTVFRKIPTRRTDGVEFVSASMDGRPFPPGDGPGSVTIRRRGGLRVEWRFPPTQASRHSFELTYVAHGVAQSTGDADLVAWRALPSDHDYAIEHSMLQVLAPEDPKERPSVTQRRVGHWALGQQPGRLTIAAERIRKNGWIELSIAMPKGSLIDAPPAWQQRQAHHARYRNPSLLAAGGVVFAGLVLLFGIRQNYDSPPPNVQTPQTFHGPPDALPPALAGALAANGNARIEHALGALFSLAARGIVEVHEEPARWGTRHFAIERRRGHHALAPHEQAALDTVFSGRHADADRVTLSKARSHLTMRFSRFRDALREELSARGFIDTGRQQVRHRYHVVGVALLATALLAVLPVVLLFERFGPWLLAVPAAILFLGAVSFIVAGAHTPLSNDGVRRAAEWRAYRKFLREMPSDGVRRDAWTSGAESPTAQLPFAVALGLGILWSKLFKDRGAELPAWFHAAASVDAHRAFAAFVGTGGASSSGGGSSGGGAAGGGGSGAG